MPEKAKQEATHEKEVNAAVEPDLVVDINVRHITEAQAANEKVEKQEAKELEKRSEPEAKTEKQEAKEPEQEKPTTEARSTRGQPVVLPVVEPPQAGAVGMGIRSKRADIKADDELLAEILIRAIPIALRHGMATPDELQGLENVLKRHGVDMRSISLDSTGFVVYEEIARQFTTKPLPKTIGRNHWPNLPMRGVKKATFPALDTTGIQVQWGRGTGAPSYSDPAFGQFEIELDSLEAFTEIYDEAAIFNPAGVRFVQEYLIPGIREALQFNEDKAFFLSNGAAPYSDKWKGLKYESGVTELAPADSNGDPLSFDVLDRMIKALPPEYADPSQLAFYLAWPRALEVQELLGERQTGLGDYFIAGIAKDNLVLPPGPNPLCFYRGIPVYGVAHLPTDETIGSNSDGSTGFLVYRKAIAIGDGGALRFEPNRPVGFKTVLQFQEWVGLGYGVYSKTAIVRATGIRPKA